MVVVKVLIIFGFEAGGEQIEKNLENALRQKGTFREYQPMEIRKTFHARL